MYYCKHMILCLHDSHRKMGAILFWYAWRLEIHREHQNLSLWLACRCPGPLLYGFQLEASSSFRRRGSELDPLGRCPAAKPLHIESWTSQSTDLVIKTSQQPRTVVSLHDEPFRTSKKAPVEHQQSFVLLISCQFGELDPTQCKDLSSVQTCLFHFFCGARAMVYLFASLQFWLQKIWIMRTSSASNSSVFTVR